MKTICMLALASFTLACSRTEPPVAPATTSAPEAPLARDQSPSRSLIAISDDIRRACGISQADAHFAFDSSAVTSADYPTLNKLVQCFQSGPLSGRQMRLVGHADPRGNEEYNLVLGGSRADGVKSFLRERGLGVAQVASTSRGEMDAKGTDEASWAQDRRVDVLLAD